MITTHKKNKVLFVKPPDRFLENEFVYQQLGPHYLQSFLKQYEIIADILVLYEQPGVRNERELGIIDKLSLDQLNMLFLGEDGRCDDYTFDHSILNNYDIIGMSVMSPQAQDAYLLNELINELFPKMTTVIGGSHPRYYEEQVKALPKSIAFDFIVPQDGWGLYTKLHRVKFKNQKNPLFSLITLLYLPISQHHHDL